MNNSHNPNEVSSCFLFLFQVPPIYISDKLLEKIQMVIMNYDFQREETRLSKYFLFHRTTSGGWGIPNLYYYYYLFVFQVKQVYRIRRDYSKHWVDTESKLSTNLPLQALSLKNIEINTNPFTVLTVQF